MKRISLFLFAISLLIVISGCSRSEVSPQVNLSALNDLPVLSIETKSTAKSVMDFVTKPITSHVSESIASWTPDYEIPPAPYYEACSVTLTDTDQTVLLDAVNADVKVRGNWTTSYDKKPLRIKFEEAQGMLGLNDGATFKNWLLLAEYKDASMLRNKTALALARELLAEDGLYASDATLVEVVINGQYWGVYLLAEQQQVNQDRVDITEVPEGYTGTDIGYFIEFDGYAWTEDSLQQFYIDYADNTELIPFDGNGGSGKIGNISDSGYTIKSDIYSEKQRNFIASYIKNVYYIMYAAAYKGESYIFNDTYTEIIKTDNISPKEAIERVVDVNSLADAYLINELLCDADIYWSSFFMSADFGPEGNKKLTFEAPWDYDSSLGLKDRCLDGTGFYAASTVPDVNGNECDFINPWLAVLAYEDWYQDIITEKWTKAYDSGVFDRVYAMIESDKNLYTEAFDRNYERWDNINNRSAFESELSWRAAACRTQQEATDFLLEWLKSRVEFLNEYWHS